MGEIAVVTGASGYLASWIVKELLAAGYEVRATVRSKGNAKVEHLEQLGQGGRLRLYEADLLEAGSFDEAVAGAQVVFHTASPFLTGKVKDLQRQLIGPALEGTRNVLRAVEASTSVRRVVLTSSVAALYGDAAELRSRPGGLVDEAAWNTTSTLRHQPYSYSKTLAEQLAWSAVRAQPRWTLTTVLPGFVVGPALSRRTDGTSTDLVLQLLDGRLRSGVPDLRFAMVDVRDVARAHLLAAQPQAEGRYIVAAESLGFADLAAFLRERFPGEDRIPRKLLPAPMLYLAGPFIGFSWRYLRGNLGLDVKVDASRSRALGVRYGSVRDAVIAQGEQLLSQRAAG